jgi:predicted nucleic acid-binding protein
MFSFYQKLSSKQQRIFITVVLGAAITSVLLIAIPTVQAILKRHGEIQTALELMEQQYQTAQKSKRTLRELSAILDRITPFSTAYIKTENERQFITEMESLATTYNVTQTFSIEPIKAPDNIRGNAYALSVRAQGTYSNLITYLHALQQQPITISLNTVELSTAIGGRRNTTPTDTPTSQMSLQFSGFLYAAQ